MCCVELALKRHPLQQQSAECVGVLVLFSALTAMSNKAEIAVHDCHCLGDMAVRMRKVVARPLVGVGVCHLLLLLFYKRDYCDLIELTLQLHTPSDTFCSQAYSVICSQFVAHPYSQLMLNSVLYDRLGGWEDSGFLTKLILGLLLTVSGPLLALCYFLFPNSRISKLLRRPIVKFTNHTGSFCMFLMLLIFSSVQDRFYDVLQFQVFGKYILQAKIL